LYCVQNLVGSDGKESTVKIETIEEITINPHNRNQLENKTRSIPLLQSNASRITGINEKTTETPHYSLNPPEQRITIIIIMKGVMALYDCEVL